MVETVIERLSGDVTPALHISVKSRQAEAAGFRALAGR